MTQHGFRIASYNIRKARGTDGRRAPERVLDVINALDADVVVLQETDKRLGARPTALPRRLIETETDFDVLSVARNEVSLGWHGNAVLLRNGVVGSRITHIDLPGLEPRGAVRADLSFEDRPGTRVTVVAAHLGLRRRDRRKQLAHIREATGDGPAVIAGDFNEWSPRAGLEALTRDFEVHSPGKSFHARRPIAALDRIALSRGVELRDAGVDEGPLARVASDHLPIWADLRLNMQV